jgi:hypothetical protein
MSSSPRFTALLRAIPFGLLLLVFSSCNAVYVGQPVGERVHALKPEEWNGTWQGDDHSTVTLLVTHPEKGELQVGWIETEQNALVLKTESFWVRESGSWLFLNHRSTHEGKERYSWTLMKRKDEVVVAWSPELEKFRALVRSGKIEGVAADHGDVYLESLSAGTLASILSGDLHLAIEWESPALIRRVKK